MSRRYSGEDHHDYQDRVTADAIQEEVDNAAEAKVLAMAQRQASGTSPEVLSMHDALVEGQRAGQLGLSASLNPNQASTPEYAEWERGRSCVIGARLNSQRKYA